MIDYKKAVSNIRRELKTYVQTHGIKSLVLGVSGGMDSCLCAALAKPVCDELGIPLIGASLPTLTNENSEIERARLTGRVFCHQFYEESIGPFFQALSPINSTSDGDNKAWKIRNGNIKARLRMIYLYNLASKNCGMVLSTDNYTELMLGFWTLHGDVGDYGMIQNLWKSEVYNMSEWIAKNECKFLDQEAALTMTIEALATDGLGVTSKGDLGQIMPDWEGNSRDGYEELDQILQAWLEGRQQSGKLGKSLIEDNLGNHPAIQRHIRSEFKRRNPENISRDIILN